MRLTFQNAENELSLENREVLQKTRETTRYKDKRYEVAMPFNTKKVDRPSEDMKKDMWKMDTKKVNKLGSYT